MSGVVLAAAAMQVKMRAALGRCLKTMGYDPRSVDSGDLFDEIDDTPPQLAAFYTQKGLGQGQAIGSRKEVGDVGRRGRFAHAAGMPRRMRRAFEEECNRHLEDVRDLLQPAGANAVSPFFVFLNLLESEPKSITQLFLTHAQHHSAHADGGTNMSVDRVRRLLSHRFLLCPHFGLSCHK